MLHAWFQGGIAVPPVPVGQQQWTTPGTYQWTVPAGVKSVSFCAIGAGSSGYIQNVNFQGITYRGYGGLGGKYIYRDTYTVTPGQVITVVVGSGGTGGSGSSNVPGNGGGISSFAGIATPGPSGSMGYGPASGSKFGNDAGWAAKPEGNDISNGNGKGTDLKTGLQTSRVTLEGALCGGGGTGTWNGSSGSKTKGGDGGVRVIWGPGRAFPYTLIGDVATS